jgi:cytoskeletal protein RodZ
MRHGTFPGDELREHRERARLSVTDASARTLIPVRYIEALEAGDMGGLPPSCYVLGFLKSYCGLLGIGPEPYVDRYRACVKPRTGRRFLLRQPSDARGPSWMPDLVAWATVCAILAFGWFAYTVVVRPNAKPTDGLVEAGALEMVVPGSPTDSR